jgi:hypothetical protein
MRAARPKLEIASQDPTILRAQAALKREQGDELGALAHLIAAQAVESCGTGAAKEGAQNLCKVSTGYFMKGDDASAERWYRLVLTLDPEAAVAYQNLAAICARSGRLSESRRCRARAYEIQRVFIESAGHTVRSLLILYAGRTSGNVPLDALLSTGRNTLIKYAIDYAAEEEDRELPPFDLVFNAVGDPDISAPLANRLLHFVRDCNQPLLNAPSVVASTARDRLSALLGDIEDVVVPACISSSASAVHADALRAVLEIAGVEWPILVRPAASHGGEGLIRCEGIEEVAQALRGIEGIYYLTTFRDYRSADGSYRKYRVVFIDREPLPYHLAISSHWMVHYFSAAMIDSHEKIEEERRFLRDPGAALGARVWAAVTAIGRRLDLDYGGIDFSVQNDGRVLVFEANATMLVHRERMNGPLAHKNPHVQRIVDEFEHMLSRRSGKPPGES